MKYGLGFSVPNQVSILGVDDVRPLTEGEGRSLSSVRPDFEKMGYVATKELVRMLMRHRPSRFKEIVLPVEELVVRKSTVPSKDCNKIVDKLGAANRAEAIAIALRKHLLKI